MKEEIYHLSLGNAEALRCSLTGVTLPDPEYAIERKASGTSCIEYVRRGRGVIQADGRRFEASAGDAYYLEERHDHVYRSDPSDPWEKVWINFSGRLARRMTECYGIGGRVLFPSLMIGDLLDQIVEIGKTPPSDAMKRVTLLLHEIMLRMSEQISEAKVDGRAAAMRSYLDGHVSETVRIEHLARAVGISPSGVNRLFRAAFGVTPYAYLARKRIELASELLLTSTLSIKAIAAHLAYADEFYFSCVFRKSTGHSPSEFRRLGRL